MSSSYGWRHATETIHKGKKVYIFGDGDDSECNPLTTVGWGAIYLNTNDATDDEAFLSVGVYPASARKGYRLKILAWLAQRAFSLGASQVSILVFKGNDAAY